MYTPWLRLVMILGCLGAGIYLVAAGNWIGVFGILAGVLLVWGYFRYGTVWIAFKATQRGQFERARALLQSIRSPELLNGQNRTYYHLAMGLLAAEKQDYASGEKYIQKALEGNLRTDNDRAVASFLMAGFAMQCGDRDRAREHIARAASVPSKPAVQSKIEEFRKMLEDPKEGKPAGPAQGGK